MLRREFTARLGGAATWQPADLPVVQPTKFELETRTTTLGYWLEMRGRSHWFAESKSRKAGKWQHPRLSAASVGGVLLRAGIDVQHLPPRGLAQAIPDLLGGQIQLMADSFAVHTARQDEAFRGGRRRASTRACPRAHIDRDRTRCFPAQALQEL